jgi:dTDP-glucose 4,6-dehydratase
VSRTWLVTGGLGFVGSHFIRLVLKERVDVRILNFDAMTYAGNPANLADIATDSRYRFFKGDICDARAVDEALSEPVEMIVNFAAESHVDRSIIDPAAFLRTDILGTHILLEAVRRKKIARFLQVSTDEVYGHVPQGHSKESDRLAPRSPYSASKAGGDLQVLAYGSTYGSPVLITRGSNTYGSHQYPEKLIPLFVTNLLEGRPVPLYGDGLQVRDWIHVEDHARGILHILEHGHEMNVYNVGGGNPRTNLEITQLLLAQCGRSPATHIRHVADRPGHDRRYSVDCRKAAELGWAPRREFTAALNETVEWYRDNAQWWRPIRSGSLAEYFKAQYAER